MITGIAAAGDALYVQDLDGGIGRLRRLPYSDGSIQPVNLPFYGAIQSLVTNPTEAGAWLELTSWTKSPLWYSLDAKTDKLTDTALVPPSPVDYSQIESEEVKAKSADGTMVPLSIIHKRGLVLDGSHPTWLAGYGAYGINLRSVFRSHDAGVPGARRSLCRRARARRRRVRRRLAPGRTKTDQAAHH